MSCSSTEHGSFIVNSENDNSSNGSYNPIDDISDTSQTTSVSKLVSTRNSLGSSSFDDLLENEYVSRMKNTTQNKPKQTQRATRYQKPLQQQITTDSESSSSDTSTPPDVPSTTPIKRKGIE